MMNTNSKITLREICPLLWTMNAYIELHIVNPGHAISVFTNAELTENYGGVFADYIVTAIEGSTHDSVNVYLERPEEDRRKCLEQALEEEGW